MRAIIYVAICLLTGCLSRPPLNKQTFIFSPTPTASRGVGGGNRVIKIRTLQVAEPFQGRSFVYRTGEYSYQRDPYAEFMVPPADGLITPICSWLRETGDFSAVVEAGSALKPDTLIEIQVVQLYGDFRQSARPTAVLTMRFVFFDAPGGLPGRVILQHEYSRSIPLKARTAPDLITGWNHALAQILDSAALDFSNVDPNALKP